MLIGPYEFQLLRAWGRETNFALDTSEKGREDYERNLSSRLPEEYSKGSFERHAQAIANLCSHGLLGLDTLPDIKEGVSIIHFSYHWTELGNCLLEPIS